VTGVDSTDGGTGTEGFYDPDGTDPEQDSGVLDAKDTLEDLDGVEDSLDTGWSPPERPWGVDEWGTTEREESAGEGLDGRLARELPDTDRAEAGRVEGDGLGDASDTDGELLDDEVGDRRAGRLVEDDGEWDDEEPELHAADAGIDSAAASAEEAAVHVVRERYDDQRY
jgi:hypothetical protein